MKKQLALLFFITAFFMTNTLAFAQGVPKQISYQGKLLENEQPVTGTKNFTFSFVDTEWSEDHENVEVTKGLYFVTLGSINPIPISIIEQNSNIKLRITVNGVVLQPDVPINSAITTLRAEVADRLKGNSVFVDTNDNVGIGKNTPQEKLDIDGGIRLGTTNTVNAGTIRWTGSDFEGYNGKEWVSLTQKKDPVNGTVIEAVAGEHLNGEETPVPVYMSKDGLILQQTTGQESASIFGINKYGQTFKTDAGTTVIKKISLKLEKVGSPPGNIDVSVFPLQQNGFPTQFPIRNLSVSTEKISTGWNSFEFSDHIELSPLTSYAIILIVPNGESEDYIKWFYSDQNTYNDGSFIHCSDYYNTSWSASFDNDFVFKLYANNRVFACVGNDLNKIDFLGFAIEDVTQGEKVFIQTDGLIKGFSDLQVGKNYYIQNEIGTIDIVSGYYRKCIGTAVNESSLVIIKSESIMNNANLCKPVLSGENIIYKLEPTAIFICNGKANGSGYQIIEVPGYDGWDCVIEKVSQGQSFIIPENVNRITKIEVEVKVESETEHQRIMTCSLYEMTSNNIENATFSKKIESVSLNISPQLNGLITFTFDVPLVVTPNNLYGFILESNASPDYLVKIQYSVKNLYNAGCHYRINKYGTWNKFETTDLTFRVHGYNYSLTEGKIYQSNNYDVDRKLFLGFALTNANKDELAFVQFDGIVTGFSNLKTGYNYYVQNNGSIGIAKTPVMVGKAVSNNDILIIHNSN